MRGIHFLFLLLTPFSVLFAQNKTENQKGLLWEISGNGLTKPGFLYGTMHVSEKLVFNLSDSFFLALQHVDVVALETNHDEWQSFTSNLLGMGRDPMENPSVYGSRIDYQNLYYGSFEFPAPTREMLSYTLSTKPTMTNEFLYRSNDYQQDYEEDTYLDLFIFQAGKKLGKKVIGLETLEDSYEAVMRARLPDPDANQERRNYGTGSNVTLEVAYREQDLALIDSINRMTSPGKNFQKYMLDDRNTIMVHGIDSILQHQQTIFAAVGAAHLPGETGIIQQLRKKGYHLRAVQFTDKAGTTDKDAIDKLRYPITFARTFLPDSSWSAEAPGKFYLTQTGQQGVEQHLIADMSNGAYYAVNRLKTNGWWNGQSPAYIADRIDSLIYEHIPGKIYDRKRITAPFPGHEISSRTRRGDVLRFKIMVTPQEIVVFSCGGNGNYAQGPEADRFLQSIQYTGENDQKTWLQPKYDGFQVKFPAPLRYNSTDQNKPAQFLAVSELGADSSIYFLYRTDYHDFKYIEEDTFELNILGETIAEQFTKTTPAMRLVSEAPYPTQDIEFTSDRDHAHFYIRLVIDGPLYYMIGCRKNRAEKPQSFLESFEIQPFKYPAVFSTITDTSFHYRVSAIPKPILQGKAYLDKLKKIYEESAQKLKQQSYEEEYYYADKTEQYTVLESPYTDEVVSVRMFNAPQGVMLPSLDSLKKSIQSNLSDQQNLLVRKADWEEKQGILVGNFLLEDTNSTRGIRVKLFVINRKSYRLMTTVNLKKEESAFIHSVYNSFTLTDTLDGTTMYGKRNLGFLESIYAKDSLERMQGLDALSEEWRLEFRPEDFPALKKAILNPGFDQLHFRDRKVLINALGQFYSADALDFALQFYQMHTDSVRYQAAVLRALAHMETKNSFHALLDLMQMQPIFLDEEQEQIFMALGDTLSLSATLLPSLINLAELDAFRTEVYNLIQNMVQEGLVKPKAYRKLVPTLLRETSWEISKYQFQEENRREKNDTYYASYGTSEGLTNIMRNLTLLAPLLQKNPAVKALAERLLRIADPNTKVQVYGLYLRNGIPVDPQLLEPFRGKLKTHFPLFRQVAYAHKLEDFGDWFRDTTLLIESYMVTQKDGSYNSSGSNIDSVRFLSRYPFMAFKRPAYIYFFEVKEKDSKNWVLAQVTVEQQLKYFTTPERKKHQNTYFDIEKNYWNRPMVRVLSNVAEKDKATYIHKKLGEIRFTNRQRYRAPQDDNYYYPGY